MKKLIKSSILSVVMLSVGMGVQAQTYVSEKFSSTYVVVQQDYGYKDMESIQKMFNRAMREHDVEYSVNEGLLYLLGASEVDEQGRMAISVTSLLKIPEQFVKRGEKAQIFYSEVGTEDTTIKITEEGNEIREYVSGEFLRQYHAIWEQRTLIVEASKLEEEINKIVEEILEDEL